jgi:hypothetical protein
MTAIFKLKLHSSCRDTNPVYKRMKIVVWWWCTVHLGEHPIITATVTRIIADVAALTIDVALHPLQYRPRTQVAIACQSDPLCSHVQSASSKQKTNKKQTYSPL